MGIEYKSYLDTIRFHIFIMNASNITIIWLIVNFNIILFLMVCLLCYLFCMCQFNIVTTIGRGNGAMLVLLDLSAAFDTIDHDNLFCILEKYVGICGNALKLINYIFLTVLNVFKLRMFCLILLILFVVFLKPQL